MKNKKIMNFEREFMRNIQNQRMHIKVNDRVFDVKKSDKAMLMAGYKLECLLDILNDLEDIEELEILQNNGVTLKDDEIKKVNSIMKTKNSVSECVNDIITIMSGKELLDYVDDELELETNDKMELAMTLYQMPQEGVSNTDEDSFRE